jgi:hypothetical protein
MMYNPIEANEKMRLEKMQKKEASINPAAGEKPMGKTSIGIGMKDGGSLKDVPKGNTGLGKLPTGVRNNMGYKNRGGMITKGGTDYRKSGMFYGGGKV